MYDKATLRPASQILHGEPRTTAIFSAYMHEQVQYALKTAVLTVSDGTSNIFHPLDTALLKCHCRHNALLVHTLYEL